MDLLTLASFTPHVGDGFRVRLDAERTIDVALVEVKQLRAPEGGVQRVGGGREPFALYFKGPGHVVLPQGTYRIEHDAAGAHDIFIVAIGPSQGGILYEAIFT